MGGRIFAGLVVLLGGCSLFGAEPEDDGIDDEPPFTPPATLPGDRLKGEFNYVCVADRDPACLSEIAQPFPAVIAAGGEFGLGYTTTDGLTLGVRSGSPLRIAAYGAGTFKALVPGSTGMLAYEYPIDDYERIVDFLSLAVATPETVVLRRNDADVTAMTLEVGHEAVVIAVTRDSLDEDLAGTLLFEWSLEPPGPAEIVELKAGGVRIRANGPGDATITAQLGELSASASIRVNGAAATTGVTTGEPTSGSTATTGDATTGGSKGETSTSTGETTGTDTGAGETGTGDTTSAGSTTSGETTTGTTETTGTTGTTGTTTGETTGTTTGETTGTTGTTTGETTGTTGTTG